MSALNLRRLQASANFDQAMENASLALTESFKVQRLCVAMRNQVKAAPPSVLVYAQENRLVVKVFRHN